MCQYKLKKHCFAVTNVISNKYPEILLSWDFDISALLLYYFVCMQKLFFGI